PPFILIHTTAPTAFYTLSLHDALPISRRDSKAGLLAPRHRRDSRGLRLTSVTATRKITNHECNQERRAGVALDAGDRSEGRVNQDRKSTRLNSSHLGISYAVFRLKKKR